MQCLMSAGFAKICITPKIGCIMGGHPGLKKSTGVLDDLYVRAMVLENGAARFIFLSVDTLFLEKRTVQFLRKGIENKFGGRNTAVFACAIHTHSGPLTTKLYGAELNQEIDEYMNDLESKCVEAATQAIENLEPVQLGYGRGALPGYSFPARYIMKNGTVETHPWKNDPNIMRAEGERAQDVSFLYAVTKSGELLGGIVNYANHPQCMERGDTRISADFPGSLERTIHCCEKKAVILFFNGACGDLCPVNAMNGGVKEVGPQWVELMGRKLAKETMRLYAARDWLKNDTLCFQQKDIVLDLRELPLEKLREAHQWQLEGKLDVEFPEPSVSNYGVEGKDNGFISLADYLKTDAWKIQEYRDLLALEKRKTQNPKEKITICAALIGQVAIAMLPFETFLQLGQEIEEKSPFPCTVVTELTNGSEGYLPTKTAFDRPGSYETLTLISSRFAPDSGKKVVDSVVELLSSLYEKTHMKNRKGEEAL